MARRHSPSSSLSGLVIAGHGRRVTILDEQGGTWSASLRRRQLVVTGDRVRWQAVAEGQGVVESIEPRERILARPDENGRERVMAANIDLVAVTFAPVPAITDLALDAYLVAAEHLDLDAVLVLNKHDLVGSAGAETERRAARYQAAGYTTLKVRAHAGTGLTELHETLRARSSVLIGPSGVGKSSLIRALIPESNAVVGNLVRQGEHGAHTTSASRLFFLPDGGHVIDSPGIREFGLWQLSGASIANGFREFHDLSAECRFRNCAHREEPGCAVLQSLEDGTLFEERYDSYISLLELYGT